MRDLQKPFINLSDKQFLNGVDEQETIVDNLLLEFGDAKIPRFENMCAALSALLQSRIDFLHDETLTLVKTPEFPDLMKHQVKYTYEIISQEFIMIKYPKTQEINSTT